MILRMLEDQQRNILQLTETINNLSSQLKEQAKINENLSKQQDHEGESIRASIQLMQKNTVSALNRISKDVPKACCILLFLYSTRLLLKNCETRPHRNRGTDVSDGNVMLSISF